MGNNYYVRKPNCEIACEHCDSYELIHLGKSSMGWKFSFQAQQEWPKGKALSQWIHLAGSGPIEDEYGAPVTLAQMLSLAMSKQTDTRCHLVFYPGMSGPDEAFWKSHTDKYDFHCGGFDFSYAEFS